LVPSGRLVKLRVNPGIFRLVQARTNFDAVDPLAGLVKRQGKLVSGLA
jgi:hypothetical protein